MRAVGEADGRVDELVDGALENFVGDTPGCLSFSTYEPIFKSSSDVKGKLQNSK